MKPDLKALAKEKAEETSRSCYVGEPFNNNDGEKLVEQIEKALLEFGAKCLEEMRIEIDDCPDLRMDELVSLKRRLERIKSQLESEK